jgi:hypothetical protein
VPGREKPKMPAYVLSSFFPCSDISEDFDNQNR